MKLAAAAQMRELDRKAIEERKIPSIDLMERAAEAARGEEGELAALPFLILRGEDIYAPENQKLLFPIMSSSSR